MKPTSYKRIIASVFGFSPPIIILGYSLLMCRHSFFCNYVVVFSLMVIFAFIISFSFQDRFGRALRFGVLIFGITYLLLEVATYFMLSFDVIRPDIGFFSSSFNGSSQKMAVYDSICGYKALPGSRRYVNIDNGELQYDNIIHANLQGWYSTRNYSYRKANSRIKRYMVLGDSFSSGIVVPSPWPDVVQKMLLEAGNDSVELYNFSLDGTGIENWYMIFMQEIVPQYEFDGVIIATSHEKEGVPDLDRIFFMANSYNNITYIQHMDVTKKKPPASFPLETAAPMARICSDSELDKIKSTYTAKNSKFSYRYQKPDLWFLRIFFNTTDALHKIIDLFNYREPFLEYPTLTKTPYKMEYFDRRYKNGFLLKQVISFCKKNNKDVILVNIPDYAYSLDYVNGKDCIYRNEHTFLYHFFGTKHFDGFEIFKGKNESFVRGSFYQYDMHWNTSAVDLFSSKFIESGIL